MRTVQYSVAVAVAFASVMSVSAPAVADDDYNFEHYASYEKGCKSIIFEDRRRKCSDLSDEKERYCIKERLKCELSVQKKTIEEYKEAQEKLKTINDSDRSSMESKIARLRKELDERKDLAKAAIPRAESCTKARDAVQEMFEKTIPLVKTAGDNAVRRRQALLDKLKDAEAKRDAAKKAREAKPDDSSARSDHEKAIEEVRSVEKELESFNQRNGKDIARQVERLERHYVQGKADHAQSIADDNKHHENCKEIVNLSY